MKSICRLSAVVIATFILTAMVSAQSIPVIDGQSIAFLGDSITQFGANNGCGYVRLVGVGLEANGVKIKTIPAGISGHKSNQMLARLDKDVLSKKPDWMTLSCGVNDVWHGSRGVKLEDYKKNITEIVDQAQAAGIKVMILTATMIHEDPTDKLNQQLEPYNAFLRNLAKEKKCLLADLYSDMLAMVNAAPEAVRKQGRVATIDGVHMNPLGDEMMAKGILRAFGLHDDQLAKAQAAWRTDDRKTNIRLNVGLSIEQYQKLRNLAAEQDMSVDKLISAQVEKLLK
jgi:lysophospholipase L1-like esterase